MAAPTTRRVWLGAGAAVVVLAVLAVAGLTGRSEAPAGGGGAAPAAAAARLDVPRRDPADPLALGRVDAPVVIAEWGDFQCPFCRAFAVDTEPALVQRYGLAGK